MTTVTRRRTIAAAPEAVWDVLADFGSLSAWAPGVDHSCVLEHGAGDAPLGTSRRVQVGRMTLVERITDISAPRVLGYDIEGLPRRLRRVANRWDLSPATGGSTEVAITTTVEIGANPVARAAEHLVCRMAARQSDAMLSGLAEKVEGPQKVEGSK